MANKTPPLLVGHFSKRRLKKYCGNTVASCEDLTTSAWALRNDHHRIQPPPRWISLLGLHATQAPFVSTNSFWGELLMINGNPGSLSFIETVWVHTIFSPKIAQSHLASAQSTWQLQKVCSLLVGRDALVTLDLNISKDGVRDLQTFIFATKYSTWLPCVLWHLHPTGPPVPKDSRNHLEMTAGLAFVDEWLLVSMVRG